MTKKTKQVKRLTFLRHIYAWLRENGIRQTVVIRGQRENEYMIDCLMPQDLLNLKALTGVRVIDEWGTFVVVNLFDALNNIHLVDYNPRSKE